MAVEKYKLYDIPAPDVGEGIALGLAAAMQGYQQKKQQDREDIMKLLPIAAQMGILETTTPEDKQGIKVGNQFFKIASARRPEGLEALGIPGVKTWTDYNAYQSANYLANPKALVNDAYAYLQQWDSKYQQIKDPEAKKTYLRSYVNKVLDALRTNPFAGVGFGAAYQTAGVPGGYIPVEITKNTVVNGERKKRGDKLMMTNEEFSDIFEPSTMRMMNPAEAMQEVNGTVDYNALVNSQIQNKPMPTTPAGAAGAATPEGYKGTITKPGVKPVTKGAEGAKVGGYSLGDIASKTVLGTAAWQTLLGPYLRGIISSGITPSLGKAVAKGGAQMLGKTGTGMALKALGAGAATRAAVVPFIQGAARLVGPIGFGAATGYPLGYGGMGMAAESNIPWLERFATAENVAGRAFANPYLMAVSPEYRAGEYTPQGPTLPLIGAIK